MYKPTSGDSQTFATPTSPVRCIPPQSSANSRRRCAIPGSLGRQRNSRRRRPKFSSRRTYPSEGRPELWVVVQLHADSLDPVGSFSIFAISAPPNAAKVESDAKEEIAKAIADGFHGRGDPHCQIRHLVRDDPHIAPPTPLSARDLAEHLYVNRDFTWDANSRRASTPPRPTPSTGAMQHFIVAEQVCDRQSRRLQVAAPAAE